MEATAFFSGGGYGFRLETAVLCSVAQLHLAGRCPMSLFLRKIICVDDNSTLIGTVHSTPSVDSKFSWRPP